MSQYCRPLPERRSLQAEHPLTASWADAMHPHGHFSRASARWMAEFVAARLRAGDPAAMVGAIAVASMATRFAHAAAIFERACELDPAAVDCLRGGEIGARAFRLADGLFSDAARHWSPPPARGWSRSIHESHMKAAATRFFGRMSAACMEAAQGDAFHGLAHKAGLLSGRDPRLGPLDAAGAALASAKVKAIRAALGAGAPMPSFWASQAEREASLRRALPTLNPSSSVDLARALFPTPAEAGAALGRAYLACVRDLEDEAKPWKSLREASGDPYAELNLEAVHRTRAHGLSSLLTHILARCPKPSFGVDERAIWTTLLPLDWSSPERDARAMEILRPVEPWPPRYVEAVRFMGEAADRLGLAPAGKAPAVASKAWGHLAAKRADMHFPTVFLSLAACHPDEPGQAQALAICSAPMRAKIEAALIGSAAPAPEAPASGAGRPRI